jgi:hypothetical protein
MATKKYDGMLIERVLKIREGIEPQPYSILRSVDKTLDDVPDKYRRILGSRVFPGDEPLVERLEKAKLKFAKALA